MNAASITMDARELRPGHPCWPTRLDVLGAELPAVWMAGRWVPAERAVAVVGARSARLRSLELAFAIGDSLARSGIDVISGGAIGVDAAAHQGALASGGSTVAVLGAGIDVPYPSKHVELFERIRGQGALLTQFPPGEPPRRKQFPARNRLIAALAELVVVVEAGEGSGSLHTARAAQALGRPVVAMPGSPGTDSLVAEGARPAFDASDVLAIYEGRGIAPAQAPSDPDAARLYAALDGTPRDVGELAFRAGLAVQTTAAMVVDLELEGLAARASGGRYIRLR